MWPSAYNAPLLFLLHMDSSAGNKTPPSLERWLSTLLVDVLFYTGFPVLFLFNHIISVASWVALKVSVHPYNLQWCHVYRSSSRTTNIVVEHSPLVYITPTYVSWDIVCTRLDDVFHSVLIQVTDNPTPDQFSSLFLNGKTRPSFSIFRSTPQAINDRFLF